MVKKKICATAHLFCTGALHEECKKLGNKECRALTDHLYLPEDYFIRDKHKDIIITSYPVSEDSQTQLIKILKKDFLSYDVFIMLLVGSHTNSVEAHNYKETFFF